MSDTVAADAAHAVHAHHEELGFLRTYVLSTDHKMIGRQFLFLGLLMLLIGVSSHTPDRNERYSQLTRNIVGRIGRATGVLCRSPGRIFPAAPYGDRWDTS